MEVCFDKVIVKINSEYKKYWFIECWGLGSSVFVDGKFWDFYEDNLLFEYYIWYGSYGGIVYYYVLDIYIVLFSWFIFCGVYEVIYILDGLFNDEFDFNLDIVYGDIQV